MLKPALPFHVKTQQLVGHTHTHMEPYPQQQAFVSRYVHGGAPYGSRHGYGGPTVPKLYKHQFTFRKPNGPVFTVTNKDRSAVLYIKKFSWFLSLSLSEIYDLAAGMNKIIERMEECRSVATGQAIHQPTCLADTETVLKMSPRRKQLDKEENAQLFYHQPMMMAPMAIPTPANEGTRRRTKRKGRKAPPPVEDDGGEDEQQDEETYQEEDDDDDDDDDDEYEVPPPTKSKRR